MKLFALVDDFRPVYTLSRWGPNGWNFIMACAFAYPTKPSDSDRSGMRLFLESLSNVLPCRKCRVHYVNNLKTLEGSALESRQALLMWINTIRNKINVDEGKPVVSYAEMIRECITGSKVSARFRLKRQTIISCLIMVALLFIIVAFVYFQK